MLLHADIIKTLVCIGWRLRLSGVLAALMHKSLFWFYLEMTLKFGTISVELY